MLSKAVCLLCAREREASRKLRPGEHVYTAEHLEWLVDQDFGRGFFTCVHDQERGKIPTGADPPGCCKFKLEQALETQEEQKPC